MITKWIDEQDFDGDKGFLISFYDSKDASTRDKLGYKPAYTANNKPFLYGFHGSFDNVITTGCGAWKVIKVAKSGRVLIEKLNGKELVEFLEDMGYPELIEEIGLDLWK